MEKKLVERRMRVFLYVVIFIFLVLVSRLVYMQLLQNDRFSTLARENRMRLVTIIAPRGEVYDRNGVKIVGNQPVYTVSLDTVSLASSGQEDTGEVVRRLAAILDMDPQEIQQKVDQQERFYEPVKLATRVPLEIVTRIEEQRMELPGVVIDIEPLREYPNGSLLAQVMGYVRQISPEQLEKNKDKGYKSGDLFGQSGLENTYEQYLRGQDGGRQVEVNTGGMPVRDLGVKEPVPGNNLVLTIDQKVQKAAEDALARASQEALKQGYNEARAGAAVALDVRTGAVLAMASYPGYDPVKLSGYLSQNDYNEIFNSPWKPILNRALLSYVPGSTFKMIVAMAGLEANVITPQDTISDPGYFFLGTRFNDWKPGGHGIVNMVRAIKVSCDTYFYQLGLKVGIDKITRMAEEFGLGGKTGIELPGEDAGVVAGYDAKYQLREDFLSSAAQKKVKEIEQRYNDLLAKAIGDEQRKQLLSKRSDELLAVDWELAWHEYDTIISAIGQGDNRYSMLQLANYVATIANGGTLYKPFLVQRVVDPNGKVIKENNPVVVNYAKVSPKTLAIVREGMREVTLPSDGTAYGFFAGFPPVAAKTGTAEVKDHDNHALIVGFAPYDNPEIAVAVIVEFAGHGGTMAGPVAESMLAAYFGLPDPGIKSISSPE
ncbi:penicillin-binding protein 2 [Pelotomaculum terephthalicicum JT]|uniref:penicillin-binding protein 2 n=1 Tax=Pelotomaculum terephthalicicum TaxID=206393 RepID=UPI0009D08DB7|nr:penicillin-binding protein 2 [Pelotomaculum terephthalicicum]MCG9966997.1 penicillin-binding protein 2 [Pelotomaculum terephthalicicum JT]OPY62630.1 MAG: Stage V sporulation protein D [Pelotomaculum sp. PtaU1.Bin065]